MADRRLALIVAVDRYDHSALHRLAAPAADADALAGVLGDPELGGFEVQVLANPTSSEIRESVESRLADRNTSDLVLLHFSGHGLKDDAGELYLAATNTRPNLLGSTAVEAAWINRVMQRSRAQRVVLLLDCCYGGAFERGVVHRAGDGVDVGDQFRQRQLGEGRGRVVITASTAMEYAFEGAQLADGAATTPSIFTGALVEGIRTGDADRDRDGRVTLGELYDYVYDRVREQTPKQTPSKWEFGLRGGLIVARNPHLRLPAEPALPPELIDLVRHPIASVRLAAVRELAPIAAGEDPTRAAAARVALEQLASDDSRQVSLAANEALHPEPAPAPVAEPDPAPAPDEAAAPALAPDAASAAPPDPAPAPATASAAPPGAALEPAPAPVAVPDADGPDATDPPAAAAPATATEEPAPGSVGDRPGRVRRTVLIAGVMVLVVALGLAGIWLANRGQAGDGNHANNNNASPARDFSALIAMLPPSPDQACVQDTPGSGRSAVAKCSKGVFELWDTQAAMNDSVTPGGSVPGDCSKVPGGKVHSSMPAGAPAGRLGCQKLEADRFCIEWGVNEQLLSGTFYTDLNSYSETYATAKNVLLGVA
ncbi:caspase family protein [Actinoplanes sp. CA-030573]|uniref:caspase family protein n=1 Tax=Actinoplanes sp. CA-030573 TaxID=3239898 RepID=UPI003D8A5C27